MQDNTQLAAIDIGSNSFRLEIARYVGGHIKPLDSLRETVRLGGGDVKGKRALVGLDVPWLVLFRALR